MALIGFGVDKFENDTSVITPMELKHIKDLYRYQCVFTGFCKKSQLTEDQLTLALASGDPFAFLPCCSV